MSKKNTAILGASDNSSRYSYRADELLKQYGHKTFLVNPQHDEINGEKCFKRLTDLKNIDTVTVYVRSAISTPLVQDILTLAPKRVIFNPGSENREIYPYLLEKNIKVEEACTLVLLNTDQY